MFFKLFQKECMQTGKSLIYLIYILCVWIFFFSQMGNPNFEKLKAPVQGQEESYGTVYSKETEQIMEYTLGSLTKSYLHNSWTTYPIGFAKYVTLSEQEKSEIDQILVETTGLSEKEREAEIEKFYANKEKENAQGLTRIETRSFFLKPVQGLSYQEFQKQMEKVCKILGPGSEYEEEVYSKGVSVPATYEQALEDYENFIEKDKISGGYARLFCDYMGIILGVMPVFVAVTRCMRDRRSQMKDLIYVRKASSWSIVWSRYVAMVVMMLLPVLLASCITLGQCLGYGAGNGISVNIWAFIPYVFGWLLPEIMIVSAVGMCLTELTDTALAILVQGIWWFADIFASAGNLSGGQYGFHLVPRNNSVRGYELFRDSFQQLVLNRIAYSIFAILLIILCVGIYEVKRKGKWDIYGKIHSYCKRKQKA